MQPDDYEIAHRLAVAAAREAGWAAWSAAHHAIRARFTAEQRALAALKKSPKDPVLQAEAWIARAHADDGETMDLDAAADDAADKAYAQWWQERG